MLTLALVCTLFPLAGQGYSAARGHGQRASKLSGVVLDVNDGRIVGAIIKIENARINRVVQSNEEGMFEVELPAGEYRITVEMNGFKRFVVSLFRVRRGARESVNIRMQVQPPGMPLKIE
jgi:sporulation protein YlmC with PRC-barrel domain